MSHMNQKWFTNQVQLQLQPPLQQQPPTPPPNHPKSIKILMVTHRTNQKPILGLNHKPIPGLNQFLNQNMKSHLTISQVSILMMNLVVITGNPSNLSNQSEYPVGIEPQQGNHTSLQQGIQPLQQPLPPPQQQPLHPLPISPRQLQLIVLQAYQNIHRDQCITNHYHQSVIHLLKTLFIILMTQCITNNLKKQCQVIMTPMN